MNDHTQEICGFCEQTHTEGTVYGHRWVPRAESPRGIHVFNSGGRELPLCTVCGISRDNVNLAGPCRGSIAVPLNGAPSRSAAPSCQFCNGTGKATDLRRNILIDCPCTEASAAPPSEREAAQRELKDYDPHATEGESEAFICGFLRGAEARAAVPQAAPIREALKIHWLSQIECNHYEKNDSAICACGWKSDRGFNVGKAVEFWIDHVFEHASLLAISLGVECPHNPPHSQAEDCPVRDDPWQLPQLPHLRNARAAAVPAPGAELNEAMHVLRVFQIESGWRGDGPNARNEYYCEFCKQHDLDREDIEHLDTCPMTALAKVLRAGATAPPKEGT